MESLIPTPATEWKGAPNVVGINLALPSGNVARVRHLSPMAFLSTGIIPDPLTEIVAEAIHKKRGLPPKLAKDIAEDDGKLQATLLLFDRVLSWVVIEPNIQMPPTCTECGEYFNIDKRHEDGSREDFHTYREGARSKDVLYADQVDITDKIFVFQFALGGTRDLERFREQLQAGLGDLLDLQDLPG